ncbi:MAG: NADH-quinone oxidoreductase subunit L [Candidatus Zixiibacteriota bacterium]|nr:MAG: NADH-quinone oxidoreductase subunit L [candidate division Zixibacteria bacterium]
MSDYLFLIPLFPLIGFITNGLLIGRLPKPVISFVGCSTVFLSFALSVMVFFELKAMPAGLRVIEQVLFTWIPSGSFHVNIGLLLDPLSAVMILVVSGVGFLIHVYSVGYMHNDPGYGRYFTYLNLFTFAMLTLVLADNFLLMFVGWEGVGLCSYLLIGFWFEKKSASDAGKKAFIVNRIGDFGFLLGMFLVFWTVGSLDFLTVSEKAPEVFTYGGALITTTCILLFVGAVGKSAQIPLYVWLPDAMEGPTPVSALIHAATMVTAGVYMVARTNALFILTPDALLVVAIIGVVTAFFAATIGLAQNDIKRVLAYSTVSQLGYMFLACGVASFAAGIFHLMTHAFFKALLFLGAGSVIHAMSDEQDMRNMGGLKKYLPITFSTMFIATLAIAGIPPLSGFFSKDEILWKSFSSDFGHPLFWILGFVTAGLTAFYMFRLVFMTFYGKERMDDKTRTHIHESPKTMTIPLIILAVFSVIGGFVGIPHIFGVTNQFEHWLEPVMATSAGAAESHVLAAGGGDTGMEWTLMLLSVVLVAVSIYFAHLLYKKRTELATSLRERFSGLHRTLLNKYYVDEFYGAVVVRPVVYLSLFLWKVFDVVVIDGFLNGLASRYHEVSEFLRFGQTGRVRTYATVFIFGVVLVVAYMLMD